MTRRSSSSTTTTASSTTSSSTSGSSAPSRSSCATTRSTSTACVALAPARCSSRPARAGRGRRHQHEAIAVARQRRRARARRVPRPPVHRRGVRRQDRAGPEIIHGKTSPISPRRRAACSTGLPEPFVATRYHSLVVDTASVPDCLEVTARPPTASSWASATGSCRSRASSSTPSRSSRAKRASGCWRTSSAPAPRPDRRLRRPGHRRDRGWLPAAAVGGGFFGLSSGRPAAVGGGSSGWIKRPAGGVDKRAGIWPAGASAGLGTAETGAGGSAAAVGGGFFGVDQAAGRPAVSRRQSRSACRYGQKPASFGRYWCPELDIHRRRER